MVLLPPNMFRKVASGMWPLERRVQSALVWPKVKEPQPCVQQYFGRADGVLPGVVVAAASKAACPVGTGVPVAKDAPW